MSTLVHCCLPTNNLARALVVPALVFIATATNRNYLTDFWHHLARGRAMVEYGGIIPHEPFTYTIGGQSVRDPNWLTQLGFYALHQLGGLPLVVTVNSLLLAAALAGVVWLCQREWKSWTLSAGLGLVAAAGLWQLLIVRPQTVSLALFVILYAVLLAAQRNVRWLLAAPPLCALWVNSHGAFPIGLILLGCFALASVWDAWRAGHTADRGAQLRAWAYCGCGAACAAATLVNPYGWRIYQYVLITSGQATGRGIDEWRPASFDQLAGVMLYVSLAALAGALVVGWRRSTAREWMLLACFLPLALQAVRMVVWWWVLLPPIIARLLADRVGDRLRDQESDALGDWSALSFCGALLAGVALSLPWCERFSPLMARGTHRLETDLETLLAPVKHTDRPARVFTRFEWGEFLAWTMPYERSIFMDGRMENYPPQVWDEYFAITTASDGWQQILDRYQVDYLLLDRQFHTTLIERATHADRWTPRGDVGRAVLLERAGGVALAHE